MVNSMYLLNGLPLFYISSGQARKKLLVLSFDGRSDKC